MISSVKVGLIPEIRDSLNLVITNQIFQKYQMHFIRDMTRILNGEIQKKSVTPHSPRPTPHSIQIYHMEVSYKKGKFFGENVCLN